MKPSELTPLSALVRQNEIKEFFKVKFLNCLLETIRASQRSRVRNHVVLYYGVSVR